MVLRKNFIENFIEIKLDFFEIKVDFIEKKVGKMKNTFFFQTWPYYASVKNRYGNLNFVFWKVLEKLWKFFQPKLYEP